MMTSEAAEEEAAVEVMHGRERRAELEAEAFVAKLVALHEMAQARLVGQASASDGAGSRDVGRRGGRRQRKRAEMRRRWAEGGTTDLGGGGASGDGRTLGVDLEKA